MQKGDYFIAKRSEKIYQLVGRWDKSLVLASTGDDDESVLIYTASELEELIATGEFGKLHKTGIKVKDK